VQQDDEAVASIQPVPVTPIDPVEVQNALNQLGFDAGPANGKLEGKSVVAIMAFQDTLGQPQTGTLTDGQTKKLLNAASVAPVPSDDSLENVETEIASTSVLPSSTDTGNSEAVIAEDLGDLDTLE
ncbi:MAG: peptidoglycan-binding domain-containing protein, partial [Pseudomonadota bacterium]